MDSKIKSLFQKAKEASYLAYSPYSNFKVGAAILTKNERVITGCNVENASYGATICAERVAICKALSEGEIDFIALTVFVQSETVFPPCGICRQFMAEFSDDMIVVYGNDDIIHETNIKSLLPETFRL